MNILPHKSWHVRTKKNIARVRKDEAQAAEEEKEKQRKVALAAQEARTAVLRDRASQRLASAAASAPIDPGTEVTIRLAPVTDIVQKDGHVNFFQDVEDGKRQVGTNEEAEAENKKEQEDYEKKIGYLVYLGQGSEESSKDKPWYANIDRSKPKDDIETIKKFETSGYLDGNSKNSKLTPEEMKLAKFKSFQDPLKDIRRYLKTPGIVQKLEGSIDNKSLKRKAVEEILPSSSSKSHKKVKKEKKKKSSKKHKSHQKSKKHKKHRDSSSRSSTEEEDSEDERKRINLERLRAERLEREREERRKTEKLLAKLRGDKLPDEDDPNDERIGRERGPNKRTSNGEGDSSGGGRRVKQKYNSQFNPELARQNYDN